MSMQDQTRTTGSKMKAGSGSSGESSNSGMQDTGVKAQQKTGEIIDQAQEKVGEVADKVKEQASSQISSQKDRAAEGLGNVADAIRQTGEQLRQNEQAAPVAQYTDQLAQGVEMVSNYLRSKSLPDIVGEIERFARREPALFLGGALTVGLLAGRFLRSSNSSSASSQNTTMALSRSSDVSSSGIYGSRSTGYSTALPTDLEPGYGSYDLPGSVGSDTLTESLSSTYSDGGSDVYSGLTTPETEDYGRNSGSTGSTGYGSSYPTSGYSSSYPTDSYENNTGQSYGSQSRTTGENSGGPIGGV